MYVPFFTVPLPNPFCPRPDHNSWNILNLKIWPLDRGEIIGENTQLLLRYKSN